MTEMDLSSNKVATLWWFAYAQYTLLLEQGYTTTPSVSSNFDTREGTSNKQ